MPDVIVRPGEPDEYTIPFTYGWERRQVVGRMRRLRIEVDRSEARAANLNKKVDRVELDGVDTVRLVDVKTGGSTWELIGYSAEWDANRAGFTTGGDLREGDDNTLITGLIGEVSSWTAGSIASLTGPMSFVFNHTHRHEALRRIEANVPGEIQFRDFGTVNYVSRLGTDRSGTVTLSSDAGTIEEDIQITERGRELDGTHIRVLGAHEGEAQLFANLVPQDDPATYENEVRYSTPRWSAEEDTDWDRWANKDVTDQDTIEEEAASLGEELKESLVEAETVVPSSVGLNVGDTVRVVKDDADLDREMRVHRLTRQAGSYNNVGGDAAVVDSVLLSTRTTLRTDDDAELEEITRFNSGWQGASVAVLAGPYGKAVDSGQPFEFNFRYPDLAYENTAEIQVKGLPYRVDSQGAASGGTTLTDDDTDPSSAAASGIDGGGYTSSTSWDVVDSFTTPDVPGAYLVVQVANRYNILESDNEVEMQWRVSAPDGNYPSDEGTYQFVMQSSDQEGDGTMSGTIFIPGEAGNRIYYIEAKDNSGGGHSFNYVYNWMMVSPHTHTIDPHQHDIDPGIFTTADTPSNVDVSINGTEVATNIGSGTFETTIDVPDEFTNDAWNTVEVSSDSLGIIEVAVFTEGYDKIGTQS